MLIYITAYPAITLIYGAIILAVWWLPKEVNPPPIDNDPLPPNQQLSQSLLKVVTGIYALLLIPACLIGFIAPWSMVGSGSPEDKIAAFLVMATFPFTIAASIIVAWILFRRRSVNIALAVTLLPIIHAVVSYFIPRIWSAP